VTTRETGVAVDPAGVSRRPGGFAPIEDYAALGDCRTVGLVARDGGLDWLAVPLLDSPALFAGVLDPKDGGSCRLAPAEPATSTRRYLPDTNVLETTFRTADAELVVTDAIVVGGGGRLPWVEVVRQVEARGGDVPLRWSVEPARFRHMPWAELRGDLPLLHCGDVTVGVVTRGLGQPGLGRGAVRGETVLRPGQPGLLGLPASADGFLTVPSPDQCSGRLALTIDWWQTWATRIGYRGPWRDAVVRSALALKLLCFTETGAIAAAATTSLPERFGGDRNYDYRFCWIRDGSFSIDALLRLDLVEEAHAALAWLLATTEATAPDVHVFYTLQGRASEGEEELPLAGYRGSQPVRHGNEASRQRQLGSFGDMLDAVWQAVAGHAVLEESAGALVAEIADRCCDQWMRPDSGIWELDDQRHYTISKIGCWVALDRAIRLADAGLVPPRHAGRWRTERDAVRAWVDAHCWSTDKRSYTFYAGTDDLDASVLLAARTRFSPPGDERLAQTVDAVRRELAAGPLVYRYSGQREAEGAFVACSFWLADALRHVGRAEESRQLIDEALAAAGNDVGLFSEEADPRTGAALGNVPQGLSHLAFVLAATEHGDAGERGGGDAG
jgi:GH15 family glucan-1,4-alpha-glucosidase